MADPAVGESGVPEPLNFRFFTDGGGGDKFTRKFESLSSRVNDPNADLELDLSRVFPFRRGKVSKAPVRLAQQRAPAKCVWTAPVGGLD